MSTRNADRPVLLRHAARWLRARVDRRGTSDGLLQSAQTWEAQYAAGRWDFLGETSELARFSVLAGYIAHLRPGGAVLDVGCGEGLLLRRLPDSCYSRYVGIDLSGSAIALAQKQQNARSSFLAADCEHYSPTEHFDAIVFNEVLICLHEPLRAVERYVRFLNAGGLVLVSMCTAARGSAAIQRQLKRVYSTVDEVRLVHAGRNVSWVCTALRLRDV